MKTCSRCHKSKPVDEFHNNKSSKDGKQSCCKVCNLSRVKDWQEKNADRFKASWSTPEVTFRQRARRYGLSVEELENLIAEFKGVCPLCGRVEDLVIDHCHVTNRVRGLLCGACNKALGVLGDSEEGLMKALDYLRRV